MKRASLLFLVTLGVVAWGPSSATAQPAALNLSFEQGLQGWTVESGNAFVAQTQPTLPGYLVVPVSLGGDYWKDLPVSIGAQGKGWVRSAGGHGRHSNVGAIRSSNFQLPADTHFVTFLIGGGNSPRLRLDLLEVRGTSYVPIPNIGTMTGHDSEMLRRDWWDVSALDKSKEYVIRIADNDPAQELGAGTAHISVDDVRFEKGDPRTTNVNGHASVLNVTVHGKPVWIDYDAPLWGAADLHTHPMAHLAMGRRVMHGVPYVGGIVPSGTQKVGSGCNTADKRATSVNEALGDCSATHGGWGTDNTCGNHIRAAAINRAFDKDFVGKLPESPNLSCAAGWDQDTPGICYSHCPDGYRGVGPSCYPLCPGDFPDGGLTCVKPVGGPNGSYGRGVGYTNGPDTYGRRSSGRGNGYGWDPGAHRNNPPPGSDMSKGYDRCVYDNPGGCDEGTPGIWFPHCPDGWDSAGAICLERCRPGYGTAGLICSRAGVDIARDRCAKDNPQGCDQVGLTFYPKCRPGFVTVGLVCSPPCPAHTSDAGLACTKNLLARSGPQPASSPPYNIHGDHQHAGFPTMVWPHFTSIAHQQMYVDWIQRAHQGGLNVMVALAVNNELFGEIVSGDGPKDDKASADVQIDEMIRMIGMHSDFMTVVHNPAELRTAVRSGKLAVIVGLEVDNFGNFNYGNPALVAAPGMVKAEINRLYQKGVRYLFPVHVADNVLGGTATYEPLFNLSNRFARTRPLPLDAPMPPGMFWQMEQAPTDSGITFRVDKDGWQKYAFTLAKPLVDALGHLIVPPLISPSCPLGQVSCVPQYKLISSLASPDLEWLRYETIKGGEVNARGLTPVGEAAILEMMRLGMFVDIDHMSLKTATAVLKMAHDHQYPVNSGHTGFRDHTPAGLPAAPVHENSRSPEQLNALGDVGGMMGIGWADGDATSFVDSYRWGLNHVVRHPKMMAPAFTLGSDINGFVQMPHPRAGGSNVSYRGTNALVQYTFGNKTYDFNKDGVAHIGLYPDMYQDMKNAGMTPEERRQFFNAADAIARMWDRMEASPARAGGAGPGFPRPPIPLGPVPLPRPSPGPLPAPPPIR